MPESRGVPTEYHLDRNWGWGSAIYVHLDSFTYCMFTYLKGRMSEKKRKREISSTYWFSLQMAAMVAATSGQNLEPGTPAGSLTWVSQAKTTGT